MAFALRPAGNRVLANVLHVLELARGFEMRGGLSFRRFVQQLDEQAETLAARHSPVVEEGAEGVRLMTVHNAKGLEFPRRLFGRSNCKVSAKHSGYPRRWNTWVVGREDSGLLALGTARHDGRGGRPREGRGGSSGPMSRPRGPAIFWSYRSWESNRVRAGSLPSTGLFIRIGRRGEHPKCRSGVLSLVKPPF